jgi:hypothetical protein
MWLPILHTVNVLEQAYFGNNATKRAISYVRHRGEDEDGLLERLVISEHRTNERDRGEKSSDLPEVH